jgi:hypothetical protein
MSAKRKTEADQLADAMEIIRKKNLENNDLRRTLEQARRDGDTADAIRQEIWGLSAYRPVIADWTVGKGGKIGMRGCPVTFWSDWHGSEVISPDEVNGLNQFDTKIMKSRARTLFNTTVDLAYNHMGKAKTEYPGIIVALGGDMISGNIHDELAETNDRTSIQAVNDVTDLIAEGLDRMASAFGKVFVPAVVGNHGRLHKKPRAKQAVFHNFDWNVYCNLERLFRRDKHIQIDVPNALDAHFRTYGQRVMLTHGDRLGVKGGDGIIGAIGPIMRGSIKVGNQVAQIGNEFDLLMMGHWHQMLWLPGVIVNNSLKGFDEYAQLNLRAKYSRPSQALFFSHPEHGITARWEVLLDKARTAETDKHWVSWQEKK